MTRLKKKKKKIVNPIDEYRGEIIDLKYHPIYS